MFASKRYVQRECKDAEAWFSKLMERIEKDFERRLDALKEKAKDETIKAKLRIGAIEKRLDALEGKAKTIDCTGMSYEEVQEMLKAKQPEPDEEWKAVCREVGVIIGLHTLNEAALAKLVVQERASRVSWTERARRMEDERNQSHKTEGHLQDQIKLLKAQLKETRKKEVERLEKIRDERERYRSAFEELVATCRAATMWNEDSDLFRADLRADFIDALELRARGS